ncbi:MAG: serine/threonine protein kinase [Myxococcaceae bacterium]
MKTLGQWEVLKKLGSGAYGEVFLASGPNRKNAPLVALKVVHRHLADSPEMKGLLEEEAWAASLLSHPNVVEVYEVSEAEGLPYLAMEFIQGQSLAALLRKMNEAGQLLTIEEAAYAVNQSALGLHYAHDVAGPDGKPLGLVHRDISPHNLIASDDGRVKVVDFGLAKVAADQKTKTDNIEGKMAYMPPEQIQGERLDRTVDVFALGAVLWELLEGQKMYPGKGAGELMQQAMILPPPDVNAHLPDVPEELRQVIVRATAREKPQRYQTALELAEALEPFITDDAAEKLAARIREYFERQPRTREEALGLAPVPKRKATVSAPRVAVVPPPSADARGRSGEKKPPRTSSAEKAVPPPKKKAAPAPPAVDRGPSKLPRIAAFVIVIGGLGAAAYFFRDRLSGITDAASSLAATMQKSAMDSESASADAGLTAAVTPTEAPKKKVVPSTGSLVLQADTAAMVSENNKALGMTPLTLQLSAGKHKLKLTTVSGDRSATVDVTIKGGEQVTKKVELSD